MRPTPSTWPCITWPPSGSPARSAGSRLTASPTASEARVLRASVSGTASKASVPPSTAVTVRQTPSTATESPIATVGAVAAAETTSRAPSDEASIVSTRPSSFTIPVNTSSRLLLVHVRAEQHVAADGLRGQVVQRDRRRERVRPTPPLPRDRRRDEQEQLVDEIRLEKRTRERGSAFEQKRL